MPPRRLRPTWTDLALGLVLLAGAVWLAWRVSRGIHYRWDWAALGPYLLRFDEASGRWAFGALLQGFVTTLRLGVWTIVLATLVGLAAACCRLSDSLFGRVVGRVYVDGVRNLPPLVLVFIAYFFVSDVVFRFLEGSVGEALGLDLLFRRGYGGAEGALSFLFGPADRFPMFLAGAATLALYEGAYVAEIIRAGIRSVEAGQWEASAALGLSWTAQMRRVVLPQAVARILPALGGQFVSAIKDSAIVALISIPELTFQARETVSATYLTFEVWLTAAGLYLALTLVFAHLADRLERRFARSRA